MTAPTHERTCSRCKTTQPLENFVRDRGSSDGRAAHCKQCQRLRAAAFRRLGPKPKRSIIERFWAKVNLSGPVHPVIGTECWEWTAANNGLGYGVFRARQRYAHRFSWEVHVGPIPNGAFVCHRCDNPGCVRPNHLFLGTAQDNSSDMVAKSRQRQEEGHPHAKITRANARDIIVARQEGATYAAIGQRFGICEAAVRMIVRGSTWRSATRTEPGGVA